MHIKLIWKLETSLYGCAKSEATFCLYIQQHSAGNKTSIKSQCPTETINSEHKKLQVGLATV